MTQVLTKNWWGSHAVNQDETALKIGPLHLRLQPNGNELTVLWSRNQAWVSLSEDSNYQAEESSRFVSQNILSQVTLAPALPDRSVSTKFLTPLNILPNERIRFFVASPLWIQVKTSESITALDIPTWRLSDTWFGSPTFGELGYSGLLPAYFSVSQLPHRSDLAITPVNIHNDGENTLTISRLSIPSDHLALYHSNDNGFWTDAITVEHTDNVELSNVQYHRRAPQEAKNARQVAQPRKGEHESMSVSRVFSALRGIGIEHG